MKVLLLGRTSETRQAIHHMLTARGHDAIVTDNRDVFWAEFIRDTYPMIFLDLSIAGYPELHICRHIRSQSRGNQSLIIMYGLRGQEVHADLLIDAGVDEFLSIDGNQVEDLDNRVILFEHHALLASIRQQASAASQSVYERLFYHLTTSPLGVIEWDRELKVLHWSQGATRLLGWKASDIIGRSVMDWPFVAEEDTAQVFMSLSALVDGLDDRHTMTGHNITSNGERIIVEWHTSVLRGISGQFISAMSFAVDVTQHAQLLETAQRGERLSHTLLQSASDLMLVIDAEHTIIYISPSVERALGYDVASLSGGDIIEFVHPDDRDPVQAMLVGLATFLNRTSPEIEFRMLHADGSWREFEATATNHFDDPAVEGIILVARDISQRKELEDELARQVFFDPLSGLPSRTVFLNRVGQVVEATPGQTVEREELLNDLGSALANSQLFIEYQPEIDLNSGAISRFEALLRWQHPLRGVIYPDELLELASKSGSLLAIGQWALEQACRTAASWMIPPSHGEGPIVSVNLTDHEFQQPQCVEMVRSVLAGAGLNPASLKLEIAESAIIRGDSKTIVQLKQLNDLSVRIVIDGFGTGYSSLDKLAQMTVETIKLDPRFVSGEDSLTNNLAILRAVTSLAHALGMDVVADGIETLEQRVRMTSASCDRGQGSYLYPPMHPEEVQALLSQIEEMQ